MNADEIRAATDAKLAELGIEMVAVYVGEGADKKKGDGSPWQYDLWTVKFQTAEGHGVLMTEDFRTGLGNRKLKKSAMGPNSTYTPGTLADEAWKKANFVPQQPTAADVLHCLCLDGEAAHTSFHDWASDLGYDTDSIKAFNTYNECGRIGRELQKMFGYTELRAISEIVREL